MGAMKWAITLETARRERGKEKERVRVRRKGMDIAVLKEEVMVDRRDISRRAQVRVTEKEAKERERYRFREQ